MPLTGGSRLVVAIGLALLVWLTSLAPSPWIPGLTPLALAQSPDQEAREIARQIKCPVCQNLSVADSPSPLAEQMRVSIQEQVAAGKSRDEIINYFVERYGEDVRLDPPKQGFAQLIWWGAGAILLVGIAAVAYFLRQRRRRGLESDWVEPVLTEDERREYETLLEQELYAGETADSGDNPGTSGAGSRHPGLGPTRA